MRDEERSGRTSFCFLTLGPSDVPSAALLSPTTCLLEEALGTGMYALSSWLIESLNCLMR